MEGTEGDTERGDAKDDIERGCRQRERHMKRKPRSMHIMSGGDYEIRDGQREREKERERDWAKINVHHDSRKI